MCFPLVVGVNAEQNEFPSFSPLSGEKCFINCEGAGGGAPVRVYVKDGKIVRIMPLYFDAQDKASRSWKIQVGQRSFVPKRMCALTQYGQAARRRIYADNRILRPLKRVDFDSEKQDRRTENRGISKYVEISWDEALSITAQEIMRIRKTYGPPAVTAIHSAHHTWGNLGHYHSAFERFFNMLGFTECWPNPESWEGWFWGAIHTYGYYWSVGSASQFDLLDDVLENAELIVYWSNDPLATHATYGSEEAAVWRLWLKELGKKQIFIDPYCNSTASLFADKWIAPKPGEDAALALAIAHTWLKEGTYDKKYVNSSTHGFDKWADYILGREDGTEKTPEWAAKISDVPARVIRALAREWGSKRTMLAVRLGTAGRAAYGHEWARMMVLLQAMQGMGKPGVNMWSGAHGAPFPLKFKFEGYTAGGLQYPGVASKVPVNPVRQKIYRIIFPDCILNPPVKWRGHGYAPPPSMTQQFTQYEYPLPKPDGAPIRMLYRYGSSFFGTMSSSNRWIRAYRHPSLEFVVNANPWFEGESKFADIVLPACTNYEREDIAEFAGTGTYAPDPSSAVNHRVIVFMQKCIEPLGESKADYDIFASLAAKLGFENEYTEGNTAHQWVEKIYKASDLPKVISWEEFSTHGYYVVPFPDGYVPHRARSELYQGTTRLPTPTGKVEFYSENLAKFDPKDSERPPVPHYIPSWEGPASESVSRYPLQLITPHSKYSFHTQDDLKSTWLNDIPNHRIVKNGFPWRPVRIHPTDAKAREIKNHDIVRVFNERGAILCIALITERIRPGVIHGYESSSGGYDPVSDKPGAPDRGGCFNMLTPSRYMSKNATGYAVNSCLVEVSKWESET